MTARERASLFAEQYINIRGCRIGGKQVYTVHVHLAGYEVGGK